MSRSFPEAAASGSQNAEVGFGRAALRGFVAFLLVAALGQAIGLAEYVASGGAYRWFTWAKVGALYLVSFFGVSVRVDLGSGELFALHLPLMSGTALAGWLLWRAGRAAGSERMWTAVAGVAVGSALPVAAIAIPAKLLFPDLGGPGFDATVRAIPSEAIVFPLVFAVALSALGAVSARPARTRAGELLRSACAGGWEMFRLALVLVFAGLLVLAVVRSDRTSQYSGWLGSQGRGGALLFGHEVLAAPNVALFTLAPAMGAAVQVGEGGAAPPTSLTLGRIGAVALAIPGLRTPVPARTLGTFWYLFLLAPALATVTGGRAAGQANGGLRRRLAGGAAAGIVFGQLVAAASWFASIAMPISRVSPPLRIQASMPSTALLALAWGIAGGVLGALLVRQDVVGDGPGPAADPPLSPTSA